MNTKINPLHSIGIIKQIESTSYKYDYKKLTPEIIEEVVNKTFSNYTPTWPIIYTDLIGCIYYDLIMLGYFIDVPKYYLERVKKGKYLATIHLYSRSGLIKAYYNGRNKEFEIKKGTKLLLKCNSFGKETFEKLKLWKNN